MECPVENHQFITSWYGQLSPEDKESFGKYWVINDYYFGFIPPEPKALFVGTFPVLEQRTSGFFYHSSVNMFWKILSTISGTELTTLTQKLKWLFDKRIAITDIVYKAKRGGKDCNSSQDKDLEVIKFNNVYKLIKDHSTIREIFLTSGGPMSKKLSGKSAGGWLVEHLLKQAEGNSELDYLPFSGANKIVRIIPINEEFSINILLTPANQDGQLSKHLNTHPFALRELNKISFLKNIAIGKRKYKCFQWAYYLAKLDGVVRDEVRKELTDENRDAILMEWRKKKYPPHASNQ